MTRKVIPLFMAIVTIAAPHAFAQTTIPLETVPLETQPLQPQTVQPQPQVQPAQPQVQPAQPQVQPAQPQVQPAQPQTAQPAAPATAPSLRATHGSWEVRCVSDADCVMTQIHRRTPGTADAVFTVIKPNGLTDGQGNPVGAFAEIVVPLGVYLPGGLGLKVDETPARAAPFERCIPEGCVVRAPISDSMLAQMKAGSTAYVVIFGAPEKPVQIPISLAGFTNAFGAI